MAGLVLSSLRNAFHMRKAHFTQPAGVESAVRERSYNALVNKQKFVQSDYYEHAFLLTWRSLIQYDFQSYVLETSPSVFFRLWVYTSKWHE